MACVFSWWARLKFHLDPCTLQICEGKTQPIMSVPQGPCEGWPTITRRKCRGPGLVWAEPLLGVLFSVSDLFPWVFKHWPQKLDAKQTWQELVPALFQVWQSFGFSLSAGGDWTCGTGPAPAYFHSGPQGTCLPIGWCCCVGCQRHSLTSWTLLVYAISLRIFLHLLAHRLYRPWFIYKIKGTRKGKLVFNLLRTSSPTGILKVVYILFN